ncbi:MAG: HOG (high osmolarity glycerol) pathway protein [Claussenomyces sp. TS43310]|nr:MAG: HOG (high osmolarity glycerol) pathway protein [Claussenomyces sp. TS43310]
MTAVISPKSSPANSPPSMSPPNPNHPPLPPLITSPSSRRSALQRPLSHASRNRMSQYSNASGPSRSRPPSHIFQVFHSSLPYTTVRDFAYSTLHPMHYGPSQEASNPPSGLSTPASDSQKRLSDPPTSWDTRGSWGPGPWSGDGLMNDENLPPIHFGDGPPWSEDEDLQSPIVVSSRHKKHKSSSGPCTSEHGHERGRGHESRDQREADSGLVSPDHYEQARGFFVGSNGDGSERYYINQGGEANGPGGEYVTYPADQARFGGPTYNRASQRDSRFAGTLLPRQSYADDHVQRYRSDSDVSSRASSPGMREHDESRYSRDYQFTIASPDEEMHGTAVALFDFERENENELPLVEGQVIWVSYRHGQGWLVAEDPKTHESGLVPEEYVRLLRDIQGGLHSLTGQGDGLLSPGGAPDSGTPTQADHGQGFGHIPTASNGSNGYQQPIVSTFSTSSKDLHPYPQHLLGTKAGQAPPQVVHYHGQRGGSQANTPTVANSQEALFVHGESHDTKDAAIGGEHSKLTKGPESSKLTTRTSSDSDDEDRTEDE